VRPPPIETIELNLDRAEALLLKASKELEDLRELLREHRLPQAVAFGVAAD
jgi:hypothetical protein